MLSNTLPKHNKINILNSGIIKSWQFVGLLFFISPICALPFLLIEIYNKKRYAFTLLAIFMGFAAWLFPPIYDSYHHYLDFWEIQNNTYSSEKNEVKFDFILHSLDKMVGYIGLTFEIVKFVSVWLCYEIIFWIFRDLVKRYKYLRTHYFLYFLLFFISIPFVDIAIGMRQIQATCLFILAVYLLYYKNIWGYVFAFLACGMHYSFLLYIIPFIIFINRHLTISNKKVFICIALIFIFFNPIIINKILLALPIPRMLFYIIDGYINGKYSEAMLEGRNLKYMVFFLFTQFQLILYIILSIKLPNRNLTSLSKFGLIILALDYCISFILFGRFIIVFALITVIALLQNGIKNIKKWVVALVCFGFISSIMSLVPYRDVIISSNEYRLALPIPTILISNYTQQWIYDHYNDEGHPK